MKIKINYILLAIVSIFFINISVKADIGTRYITQDGANELSNGIVCGDQLNIIDCFETDGKRYCKYVSDYYNLKGNIWDMYLTNDQSAATSTCSDYWYWDAQGEYYVKKGVPAEQRELTCGAKLKVTRCNGEKCYYTSYTNKNGKNIELDIPELISISSITYDENNTGCIKESEEEPKEETCVNAPQLNIDGKYTFNLCYNSKFDFEEVKDLVKNVVSCKYNRVLDESSIRATGKIVKGKKYNSSDYTVECVLKEKPSVAVESGLVDNSGYGTITVNANSKSGTIVSYYTSESLNAPTKTSKWTKVNDNIFTIKSTPGVVYIWVKDSLGNISDVVSGAVIDTKNTSTTIRTIELKDANGNSLAMKAKNKISYSVSGINNMYTRLSNQKIADNFNPFDMEYELEVDTSTVTVFATLTSNDSKFVEGYGPRTVNLSYGVNTVLIKIQNKEGKIRTYTIIVTRKDSRNADNTLKEITLSEGKIDFNANVTKYKIEIPKNTESVVVNSKLSSDLSNYVEGFEPGVVNITGNTTVKLIKVRSQTGSNRTYILSFVKEGTDEIEKESLQLFSLSIPNAYIPFESDTSNYNITVDYATNVIDLFAALKDSESSIKYTKKDDNNNYIETTAYGIPLNVGDNYINIEITDKDGDIAYYRLTIIRKEFGLDISNNTLLSDLKVLNYNIDFDPLVKDYKVKIKQEKSLLITAVPESNRAEVFITGNDNLTGFSTVRIKVVAENGTYQVYSIDISKDAFNKELEKMAVLLGIGIILLSSCIIIIKKKIKSKKDYYRE